MVKKYYAVARGRKVGIFDDWPTTQKLVSGFPGARYKSFTNLSEANAFITNHDNVSKKVLRQTQLPAHKQMIKSMAEVTFFTDGGSRNTGNVAGGHVKTSDKAAWAYLIQYQGKQYSDSKGEFGATNNRMEIMAFIEALQRLITMKLNHLRIVGVLDSRYVLNSINQGWLAGWKRRGFKKADGSTPLNVELWRELDRLLPKFSNLKLEWTKGHADNSGNVFVDKLLNQTMDGMK